jgi:cation diffusion facilitator family transporter
VTNKRENPKRCSGGAGNPEQNLIDEQWNVVRMKGNEEEKYTDAYEIRTINRCLLIGVASNVLLTIFKFIAGLLGNSAAMLSDAAHSLSDIIATIVVWIGVRLGRKQADREHPYGHERIESLTAAAEAAFLFVIAALILKTGIESLIHYEQILTPKPIALAAAIVSILVKEFLYHYTHRVAKRINSVALEASAWHHRSDALSSIGSFVGIGGAMLGLRVLDPIAALLIGCIIGKVAYDIGKEALLQLLDTAADKDTVDRITDIVSGESGVERIDDLKTRRHGAKLYVDLEIASDEKISMTAAHAIAQNVHDKLEVALPEIKHCFVHVNPYAKSLAGPS